MSRTNDITEMGEIGELAEYADVNDMQSTLTTSYTQRLQSNHSVDTAKDLTTNPDDQTVIAIDALESTPEQLQSMYENGSDPALLPETTNSTTNQASDSASSSSSLRSFAYQTPVRSDDIKTLLQVFVCNAMRSREADLNAEQIQSTCAALFSCDQPSESLFIIGNQNGELASTYPPQLLVPTHNRMPIDRKRLQQLIAKAKIARCRCRFPVPVILFNQKYICRSATLSGGYEIYGRQGMDLLLGSTEEEDCGSPHNSPNNHPTDHSLANQVNSNVTSQPEGDECLDSYAVADSSPIKAESSNVGGGLFENLSSFVVSNTFASSSNQMTSNGKANLSDSNHQPLPQTHRNSVAQHSVTTATTTTSYLSSHFQSLTALTRSDTSQVVNAVRTQDIALLDYLRVRQIVDLMVEKKKVKFGLNITSSEKADKLHRYREFDIICLPYPGCEFFKQYRNNQYQAEGLVFDWQQPFVDAVLEIPAKRCGPAHLLPIDFSAYKQWDVIKLTQNYLRLIMLNLITDNQQSMLIHCISGWDRTPLFISLLRLSLWADRRVHTTLTAEQITYLTLAYDWYLFGHNLADRVNKGEEILFFCFYFLKFIAPADYSVDHFIRESHKVNSTDQARKCCECCKPNTPIIPTTNATSNTSYSTTKSNLCASPEQIHHPNMTKIQSPMKSVAQAKVSLTTQTSSTLDDSKKKCQRKRLDVEKQKNEENAPAGDVTHSDVLDLSITDELSKMSVEAQSTAKTSSISPTSSPSSSTSSSSSTASQSPSFNCKLDQSNITTTIGSTSITTKNRSASITIDMPSIDSCASLSSCTAATIVTTTSNATTIGTPTDLNDLQLYDIISLDEQSLSSNSSIEACLPSSRFQKSLGRSSLRDSTRRSMIGHQAMMTTTTGTVVSHPSSTCKFMLDDEDDDTTPIGCLRRDECDLDDGLLLAAAEEADSDLNRNSSDTNLIRRSNAMAIPISNRRPANSVSFGTNDGQSARLALNQSNSSLPRSDSWQLVTETGSIRDKGFYSSPESFKSNGSAILFGALSSNTASNSGNLNNARSHGSFTRSGNNKTVSSPYAISSNNSANKCPNRLPSLCCCCEATCARLCTKVIEQQRRDGATNPSVDREQRLEQVRSLFYSCYSSVIGYPRHRNGPDLGTSRTFQALFSQLDTIGINPFGRISTPNL